VKGKGSGFGLLGMRVWIDTLRVGCNLRESVIWIDRNLFINATELTCVDPWPIAKSLDLL